MTREQEHFRRLQRDAQHVGANTIGHRVDDRRSRDQKCGPQAHTNAPPSTRARQVRRGHRVQRSPKKEIALPPRNSPTPGSTPARWIGHANEGGRDGNIKGIGSAPRDSWLEWAVEPPRAFHQLAGDREHERRLDSSVSSRPQARYTPKPTAIAAAKPKITVSQDDKVAGAHRSSCHQMDAAQVQERVDDVMKFGTRIRDFFLMSASD